MKQRIQPALPFLCNSMLVHEMGTSVEKTSLSLLYFTTNVQVISFKKLTFCNSLRFSIVKQLILEMLFALS